MIVPAKTARFTVDDNAVRRLVKSLSDETKHQAHTILSKNRNPPSLPYHPPARRTGALANSFRTIIRKWRITVLSTVNYSRFLEYGTKKMEPRPFIAAIWKDTMKRKKNIIVQGLIRVVRSTSRG